jgi:hypothetical protein
MSAGQAPMNASSSGDSTLASCPPQAAQRSSASLHETCSSKNS